MVLRCKRCAEVDGDEASRHSMRAKRRCAWELDEGEEGETSNGLVQINALLSLEGREIPLPSHFVGIMSNANRQTNLKAELLEYIMCSLARMGFVEARECLQDNIQLLFASEVQHKPFALLRSVQQYDAFRPPAIGVTILRPPAICVTIFFLSIIVLTRFFVCALLQELNLCLEDYCRPLLRAVAHHIWKHAHHTGFPYPILLAEFRFSMKVKQQIGTILTACS
jgi:hypothetical protein